MNTVILIGRLTGDPETRYATGDKPYCIAKYSIAVKKIRKDKDGNTADFFDCVSYGKTGEFVEKYFRKGSKIVITGRLQQDRWEEEGKKRTKVIIVAEDVEFGESKGGKKEEPKPDADGFMTAEDDEELPFH